MMIRALLFDAANTLIHKPDLWIRIDEVLLKHGYKVDPWRLKFIHKLLSESISFPDRTDSVFYRDFNSNLLFALGIIPNEFVLDDLFKACTYLPWQAFDDVLELDSTGVSISVLSNFNQGLPALLSELVPFELQHVLSSEVEKVRKPDVAFYKLALDKLKLKPEEVLYVGDSLKLDISPALSIGMEAYLIDRDAFFPKVENRLSTLSDIPDLLNVLNKKQ